VTAAAARVTGASKGGAAKGGAAKGGAAKGGGKAAAGGAAKGAAGKASKGGAAKGAAAKGAKASPLPAAAPPENQAPAEPLPAAPPPPSKAGRAVVAYNHYKGEFQIDDDGAMAWAHIDEEYCISFVFTGDFAVALVTDQGEAIHMADGKFAGLADGSRYTLQVTEDPKTAAAGGTPCVERFCLLRAGRLRHV